MTLTEAELDELASRRHNVDEDPAWVAIRLTERDALVATARLATEFIAAARALVEGVEEVAGWGVLIVPEAVRMRAALARLERIT